MPSGDPTAQPSMEPTMEPTVGMLMTTTNEPTPDYNPDGDNCRGWQIRLSFTIFSYAAGDDYETNLEELCLDAYVFTIEIRLPWRGRYCTRVGTITFRIVGTNSNRRLLQDTNDIEVDVTFEVNNDLYEDYFNSTEYNSSVFAEEFKENLITELIEEDPDNPVSIGEFTISDPIISDETTEEPEGGGKNDNAKIILISVLICLGFCCIITLVTVKLFCDHKKEYATEDERELGRQVSGDNNRDMDRIAIPTKSPDTDGNGETRTKSPGIGYSKYGKSPQTVPTRSPQTAPPSVASPSQTFDDNLKVEGGHHQPLSPSLATKEVAKHIKFVEMANIDKDADELKTKGGMDAVYTPQSTAAGTDPLATPNGNNSPGLLNDNGGSEQEQELEMEVIFQEMFDENKKKMQFSDKKSYQVVVTDNKPGFHNEDSEVP